MNLSVLDLLPEHGQRDKSDIDWESPSLLTLRVKLDLILEILDLSLKVCVFTVFISERRIDSALPIAFFLSLALAENLFKRSLHIIVPLGAHPVILDSLLLEHVGDVALNFEANGISSVLRHWLHVLEVGALDTWDWLVGSEIRGAISVRQERFPITRVFNVVREEAGVIEVLNVCPHVFRIENTSN